MSFIHDDFLLSNPTSRRLYHEYAEAEPILDYHTHLPPQDVAANRQFRNLFEIWLEGDHYKWRAMRAERRRRAVLHGRCPALRKIPRLVGGPTSRRRSAIRCITGRTSNSSDTSASTNCSTRSTAPRVWEQANEQLAGDSLRAHGILAKFAGESRLHHRRSRRRSRVAPRHRRVGPADENLPDLPPRQSTQRAPARSIQRVDRTAGSGGRMSKSAASIRSPTRCAAATTSSTRWRAPLRPRTQPALHRVRKRSRRRHDLRPRARRAPPPRPRNTTATPAT